MRSGVLNFVKVDALRSGVWCMVLGEEERKKERKEEERGRNSNTCGVDRSLEPLSNELTNLYQRLGMRGSASVEYQR